jgi:type I restriction enzyme S subunit
MNTDTFFEQFDSLIELPGGIAKIRELILQLAVQGKLVEQDGRDEPASALLVRISNAMGKGSERSAVATANDPSEPYALPYGWIWTTLSYVAELSPRNEVSDDTQVSFAPMATIPEKYGEAHRAELRRWGEVRKGFTHFAEGDVVVAKITPCFQNGKSAVMRHLTNGFGAGTTELHVIRVLPGMMCPDYILAFVKSPRFLNDGVTKMTGSAGQKRVPREYIATTPFPLPPLAEQRRIVAKVDQLMALCDELETRQERKREGRERLVESSLANLLAARDPADFAEQWQNIRDGFDLTYDAPAAVSLLRKVILELAIRGRLATQATDDEPVAKLVADIERFALEETGASRTVREIYDSFDGHIPYGWTVVPFGDITVNRDGERVPLSRAIRDGRKGKYPYYGASGIIDAIDTFIFDKPLLLIGEDGANLINRSTPIAFIATGKYWVNNHAHVLDGVSLEFLQYLELFINAINLEPYVTGTAQPKMNQAKMNSIPVLLPPVDEQRRIVAKSQELVAYCDHLEEVLASSQKAGMLFLAAQIESLLVAEVL